MKRSFEHNSLFDTTPSGVLYQSGSTSSFFFEDSSSYLAIKARALDLQALFESHGLQIGQSPTLSKLISDAIELSDAWLCGGMEKIGINHLLNSSQINRISTATLLASGEAMIRSVLVDLLNGTLAPLNRSQSKAKDTLWELELYQILRSHNISVRLGEPDIIADYSGAQVGIACKKFYSELNVSKVLSNAVKQIEKTFEYGFIALNLDDLFPEDLILQTQTIEEMSNVLAQRNHDFLRAHEKYLRRYLTPGRALAALISCSAFAKVDEAKQPFMNARQSTVWHIPGLPAAKEQKMHDFAALFDSQYAK